MSLYNAINATNKIKEVIRSIDNQPSHFSNNFPNIHVESTGDPNDFIDIYDKLENDLSSYFHKYNKEYLKKIKMRHVYLQKSKQVFMNDKSDPIPNTDNFVSFDKNESIELFNNILKTNSSLSEDLFVDKKYLGLVNFQFDNITDKEYGLLKEMKEKLK